MFYQTAVHLRRFLLVNAFLVLGHGGMFSIGLGEITHAGTLEGTVHYLGSKPIPVKVKVVKDQEQCGTEIMIHTIQLHGTHDSLSGAIVSVEGLKVNRRVENAKSHVLNMNCAFMPRNNTALQGQEIEVRNQDPIMHNTHIKLGKRTFLNVAQVPGGLPIVKRLKRPGLYSIQCDKHVFMRGTIHVFPHPYYSLTTQAGTFRITDIPPGKHPIQVWHETLGILEKMVVIPQNGTVRVNFTFP